MVMLELLPGTRLCSFITSQVILITPSHLTWAAATKWYLQSTYLLEAEGFFHFLFLWSGLLQKKSIVTRIWTFKPQQFNLPDFPCWSAWWHQNTQSLLKGVQSCVFQNWLRLILKEAQPQTVLHVCCPWGVIFPLIEINPMKLFFSS